MADEKVTDQAIVDDQDTKEMDSYEDGFPYPDNMPDEVDIREDKFTVFAWLRKLKKEQLILDPDFQRNLVWKEEQKSRFIESILLNLPLPPLYVNQNTEGKFIIVDGLQRTSTLADFLKKDDGFALRDLQVLDHLNGDTFEDLSPKLQAKIEDKNLLVYIIKPTVPLPMVYDIFNRINTGGTQLNRQEIRNCLFSGQSTRLLKELSEEPYFRRAIDNGISPQRMKDREAILRYLAFKILGYQSYKKDMDEFLNKALKKINKKNETEIGLVKQDFKRVMTYTYDFFGKKNFRLPTERGRGRIHIALLEAVGYFFAIKSDDFFDKNKKVILENYEKLLKEDRFIEAVRSSTNAPKKVSARFELVQEILGNVKC